MDAEQVAGKIIIRVLVADNTLIHTELLANALRRDRNLQVITSDSDLESAMDAAVRHNVDVLLISSNLHEGANRGFEGLRRLHASRPNLHSVILLDSSRMELILKAFRAGASGVLSRFESVKTLCKCVRCVHQGQIWASSQQISLALEALASLHPICAMDAKGQSLLSKRETEIVQCMAEGLTNREIAERLRLSKHTVKNYLFRVFDKLGASNRVELLLMTLSRNGNPGPVSGSVMRNYLAGAEHGCSTMAECQLAAEQGQLTAQLTLGQLLWNRKATSEDIVQSYKWYLIASDQVLQAGKQVSRAMTMEQLLRAEQMAADWLKNTENSRFFGQGDHGRFGRKQEGQASD